MYPLALLSGLPILILALILDHKAQHTLHDNQSAMSAKGSAAESQPPQSTSSVHPLCIDHSYTSLDALQRQAIETDAAAGVRYPFGGNYLGNWQKGEDIANSHGALVSASTQNPPKGPRCVECHQLDRSTDNAAVSGPSLLQYGKLSGGPTPGNLRYTWAKIYNAHAFTACSAMPRFGAEEILTEEQIRDVMSYLFDPASPINH